MDDDLSQVPLDTSRKAAEDTVLGSDDALLRDMERLYKEQQRYAQACCGCNCKGCGDAINTRK